MTRAAQIDDIPSIGTAELVKWLWNKWARHGEIEDGVSAARLTLLQAKVDKYEQWFSDNAANLANHRIGGYHFISEERASDRQEPVQNR